MNVSDMSITAGTDHSRNADTREPIAPDLRVAFILAPKFTIIAFASLIDCLRHAADEADRSRQIHCRWDIAAPSDRPIESSCGVTLTPWRGLPDPAAGEFDYVAVVGGLLPWCLDLPEATYDYLRRASAHGTAIAGLCTGSFILARAGLLDGRDCAVHIEHRHEFAEMFPRSRAVTDKPFVRDGGIITCPGGTAAVDLAYAMIEDRCGRAKAIKSLSSVLFQRQRTLEQLRHRPYQHLTVCGDWRVERSVDLMERHSTHPFSIARLAARIGSSVRELNRAFRLHAAQSPANVGRNIRLANAHWKLLNSSQSITQIAYECGFADTAHFSRWFRRKFGEPPMAFRHRRAWNGTGPGQEKKLDDRAGEYSLLPLRLAVKPALPPDRFRGWTLSSRGTRARSGPATDRQTGPTGPEWHHVVRAMKSARMSESAAISARLMPFISPWSRTSTVRQPIAAPPRMSVCGVSPTMAIRCGGVSGPIRSATRAKALAKGLP